MSWVITPSYKDPSFSSVVLLLHGEGADNSIVFTDSSSSPKTVTPSGNAKISAANKYFGAASMLFDGTDDFLTVTSNDLAFGTGAFTIEMFVYRVGDGAAGPSANAWAIDFRTASSSVDVQIICGFGPTFPVQFNNNSVLISSLAPFIASNGKWVHIALVRNAGRTALYVDGVSQGDVADTNDYTATTAVIGARTSSIGGDRRSLNGYIDELRITKAARYTANFTPPTAPFPDM